MTKIIIRLSLLLALLLGPVAPAIAQLGTADYEHKEGESIAEDTSLYEDQMADLDPLEPLNRGIFVVNTFLDGLLIRPMAYAYEDLVHDQIKDRVSNFLDNLNAPLVFLSDVFQGEGEQAVNTFARFLINSTFGLLGLFDPASDMGLEQKHNDMGTTLRRWGIGSGAYIVLPLFGPSSLRDLLGDTAEFAADPYNWYVRSHYKKNKYGWIYGKIAARSLARRHDVLTITEELDKTHDPYAQYRILYMQNRKIIDAMEESAVPDDVIALDAASSAERQQK